MYYIFIDEVSLTAIVGIKVAAITSLTTELLTGSG